jgi:CRP/FNR family transcriptional regulator
VAGVQERYWLHCKSHHFSEATMHIVLHPEPSATRPAAARCAQCAFRALCLPENLSDSEVVRLEQIIGRRRRVLYAVRFGHFKSVQTDRRGDQHITGFQMAGELLGMDSIGTGQHASTAIALEDSEVCEIPYAKLQELLVQIPRLMAHFHRIMGREILREQAVMIFLGNMRAEQRLASFLRGYSSRSFQLRMSREDIGGYLGLTIECISRQLARFRQNGWITLNKRSVELTDREALVALAAGLQPALDEAPAKAA